jgi:hypothetical protein
MAVSTQTSELMATLRAGRVISLASAPTRRLNDPRAMILLSQMIYWTGHDKDALQADGWLSKSTESWAAETCLTSTQVAGAIRRLMDRRLIKKWQRSHKALPWYKIDAPMLAGLCQPASPDTAVDAQRFIQDSAYRESITGRPLPYFTRLADATNDALLGLFLSRCVYWQEALESRNRLHAKKPTWGWSANDWANDIGISRGQFRTLLQEANSLRLIEVTEIGRPFPGIWVDMIAVKAKIMPIISGASVKRNDAGTLRNSTKWTFEPCQTKVSALTTSTQWTLPTRTPTDPSVATFIPKNEGLPPKIDTLQHKTDTLEGHFVQSTRARGFDYLDYTTTPADCSVTEPSSRTDVVVASRLRPNNTPHAPPENDALPPLRYPSLSPAELNAVSKVIVSALPHRRQVLLDELDGQLRSKQVRNPVALLGFLVREDKKLEGNLGLEYAHLAEQRRQAERTLQQRRDQFAAALSCSTGEQAAEPPDTRRPSQEIALARIAELKAMLKRRGAHINDVSEVLK